MRDLLSRRSCNCGTAQLNLRDLCTGKPFYIPLKVLDFLIYFILEKKAQTLSILKYAELLKRLVQRSEVTPDQSAYASYYGAKKENFSLDSEAGWLTKQKTIKKIILSRQPASVLDIGSNTGWYSLLAEKYGSTVIATDSDEASVNLLYQRAKADRLNILPLLLPFNNFSREIFPDSALAGVSGPPLFLKATRRLRSDLVLCLGLIHHLILGQGYSPETVISALSELARSTLVIEFVGLNDPLIENEKDFFPKLKCMAPTYRRDTLVTLGRKMFGECEILPSSPDTRQILVFRRQVPGVGAIDGLGMVQTSSNGSTA
jgi:SAM-dependent methyltransferase